MERQVMNSKLDELDRQRRLAVFHKRFREAQSLTKKIHKILEKS
jgi:hypothetical protein